MQKKTKSYIIGILIPLAVGGLSAFFTRNSMDVYGTITRPPLSPPGFLFPIVWTVLYVLMGIGSVMVYTSTGGGSTAKERALLIYSVQLAVNFFWSIIFFNMQKYLLAFFVIILLWVLIMAMILSFVKTSKAAAYLQVPYLLWVTFAAYLNIAIYILNR